MSQLLQRIHRTQWEQFEKGLFLRHKVASLKTTAIWPNTLIFNAVRILHIVQLCLGFLECPCSATVKRDTILLSYLSDIIMKIQGLKSTNPSSLPINMNAPDMLCQIRTGVEALRTEVPAAGVSHCLSPRGAGTALSIHHSRSGAPTGHCALQLHQGTADTERRERVGWVERQQGERIYSPTVIKHIKAIKNLFITWICTAVKNRCRYF